MRANVTALKGACFDSDDEGFVSDGSGETLVTELW